MSSYLLDYLLQQSCKFNRKYLDFPANWGWLDWEVAAAAVVVVVSVVAVVVEASGD